MVPTYQPVLSTSMMHFLRAGRQPCWLLLLCGFAWFVHQNTVQPFIAGCDHAFLGPFPPLSLIGSTNTSYYNKQIVWIACCQCRCHWWESFVAVVAVINCHVVFMPLSCCCTSLQQANLLVVATHSFEAWFWLWYTVQHAAFLLGVIYLKTGWEKESCGSCVKQMNLFAGSLVILWILANQLQIL
jgi:hypothetical protein